MCIHRAYIGKHVGSDVCMFLVVIDEYGVSSNFVVLCFCLSGLLYFAQRKSSLNSEYVNHTILVKVRKIKFL